MNELFLKFVNMSISSSWMVLAVLILRRVLKNAPKWLNPVLWGIVGLRLLLPFSIESTWSLIPSAQTIDTTKYSARPYIASGIELVDKSINEYLGDRYFEGVTVPANHFADTMSILGLVWVLGVIALIVFAGIHYRRIHRKVETAILLQENIYLSENVSSPFVLGLLRPRIYLPFKIAEKDMEHIIAHEKSHIRRRDHWVKPFGFLLLALHWFNPVMWAAYILLCRDIELACDERVIKELGTDERADYSQTLLDYSIQHRTIAACPIAFGEVGVKERVKNVLNYKKPTFWIIAVAVAACAVMAVCFLTDPEKKAVKEGGATSYHSDNNVDAKQKKELERLRQAEEKQNEKKSHAIQTEMDNLQQRFYDAEKEIEKLQEQMVLLENSDKASEMEICEDNIEKLQKEQAAYEQEISVLQEKLEAYEKLSKTE